MTFASRAELRAYLAGVNVASTLKHDRPADRPSEPLREAERAEQVLAVLRESGAI